MSFIENQKIYKLSDEQAISLFEEMLLYRRFEEKMSSLYGMGLIGGFCHLYIGQEAVLAGFNAAKDEYDNVITAYRCHAHAIASGIDIKYIIAELLGKKTGCSKGKGGSMHLFNPKGNFYGGHGIVGAQVSIGTGLAFAEQYNNSSNITLCYMGDGAVNQGQVFESFNMAALWSLPILYIIENNGYAMGTSVERSSFITDLHKKGTSFGIENYQLDGMNVQNIYEKARIAIDYVRNNSKPLLEVKTYRYKGHSMSDPGNYRDKKEIEQYKKRDPIEQLKQHITHNKLLTNDEISKIDKEIRDKIQEAADFAEKEPFPNDEDLYKDLYSD